jgi:Family of unknown function (DUF6615)
MITSAPARALLERLASETWRKLPVADAFGCPLRETTLTDDHLLEIATARLPSIRVYKARGKDEPEKGFDWEWWIGSRGFGFWRYSIQAKLLNLVTGTYRSLRHVVDGREQIDTLESFSTAQGSVPLYCFYNSAEGKVPTNLWHCPLPFDEEQLGCTLVPLDVVRPYAKKRCKRRFQDLHASPRALPWRCVVTCPRVLAETINPLAATGLSARKYERLPGFLLEQVDSRQEESGMEVVLPDEYYRSELGGHPRMIAVIRLEEG